MLPLNPSACIRSEVLTSATNAAEGTVIEAALAYLAAPLETLISSIYPVNPSAPLRLAPIFNGFVLP